MMSRADIDVGYPDAVAPEESASTCGASKNEGQTVVQKAE